MEKIINTAVYKLVLNQNRQLLYSVGEKINIFDVANNFKKVKVLDDLKNPNQVFYDEEYKILITKNTTGGFAIYDLDSLDLLKKFKLKPNVSNTDFNFIYDKGNKTIYCIASVSNDKKLGFDLIKIIYETTEIVYIPLKFELEKNILSHYSLQKVIGNELYLFNSIINLKNASVINSTYGKYDLQNGILKEIEILWESKSDLSQMIINENFAYNFFGVCDLSNNKIFNLIKFNSKFRKIPIYSVNKYKTNYAIVTSDIIYFTDDFEHIIDTIDGKYLSCYLETDEYKFVGSWESLKIISK